MKKLLIAVLAIVAISFSAVAGEKTTNTKFDTKFDIPATTPAVTVTDSGVWYSITNITGGTFTAVSFSAGFGGELQSASVVVNDESRFHWNESDGHCDGNPKDMARLRKKFDSIKLPSVKFETYGPIECFNIGIGSELDSFQLVGTIYSGGSGKDRYILKNQLGNISEVLTSEFMFPPTKEGAFRIGRKIGKYVCLVEVNGKWVIPATDYYPPAKTTTASAK